MKKICLIGLLCTLAGVVFAQDVLRTASGMKVNQPEAQWRSEVIFYTPSIVRVVKYPYPMEELPEKQSLSVILNPQSPKIRYQESDNRWVMSTSCMQVVWDKKSGIFSFEDLKGNKLLREGKTRFEMRQEGADKGAYQTYQSFVLDKEEAIYGLGQFQNGKMSQRNLSKYLIQDNMENVVPFMHSVKGYGLFWDNYSPTTFTDTPEETSFDSEVGDCVDYYFMYGGNADGVIAQMRSLTGQVPMFPLWTYGFWQSKERYKSQEEIVEVVDRYRALEVPLDGIIQDWQYWGNNYLWNAMEFLTPDYPNPKQMVEDVHARNAHLIISVWASFGPQTKPYRAMEPKGMLMNFLTWPVSGVNTWPNNMEYPSGVKVYDAYHPEARDIYWNQMNQGLFSLGMDGWWLDSTEPEQMDFASEDLENKTYLGSFRKVRNAFPLMSVGGVYDHQRALTSEKRVFILTRSAFAGQQRYGANTWSGDVTASWEALRSQIPAGLNFSLTGIPHWNADIGGFYVDDYNRLSGDGSAVVNPLYQELYVRWLQFAAFTPMMRAHGTAAPREIYQFGQKGEPIYDALEKAIRLRYSLLPYIYSTAWEVSDKQSSFLRALMMDFASDKKVWDIRDEFMFGRSILVAPIVKAQYTSEVATSVDNIEGWSPANGSRGVTDFTATKHTELYLPAGSSWYDFWTNESLAGGQTLSRESTIDLIPLYIKSGTILPIGPEVQYATEKRWDNIELRIYPGADGTFTLYEDEFDNYNYEEGAYTEIPMTWNDRSQTLLIGARQGGYSGMLETRTFVVKMPDGRSKQVVYSGKRVSIRF